MPECNNSHERKTAQVPPKGGFAFLSKSDSINFATRCMRDILLVSLPAWSAAALTKVFRGACTGVPYRKRFFMDIHTHVSLAEFTTLRLGGPASFFVTVRSLLDLREAIAFARTHDLETYILGGGSNVLFPDAGWDGLVIRIAIVGREYTENSKGDAQVIASAGEVWDELVSDSVMQGFWGIENMSFVPGTVGATPVQNVGCYGVSVSDCIDWVEVLDMHTDALHILSPGDCAFGYRDSIFKHTAGAHFIVTRVAYRLKTHPSPQIAYKDLAVYFGNRTDVSVREVREALREIRGKKFPNLHEVGTAGSFFKNPIVSTTVLKEIRGWLGDDVPSYPVDERHVKIPAAWLLEKFGFKGKQVGAVGCWKEQPLVLVHYGGGTSSEFTLFAYDIMREVKRRTTIKLEPEVCVVGDHHTSKVT